MIPVEFDEMNFTYSKPQGMTDEQCAPLHVCKCQDTEHNPVIISCWKLSKEDLEEIQRTGTLWLQIHGQGMPPVALYTEHPFKPRKFN